MGHGLGLGHIPFPSSHTSYTPPERRRRRKSVRAAGPLRLKPALAARGASTTGDTRSTGGDDATGPAALSILPDDIAPLEVRFLLGASQERMSRSFAAAFASHIVVVGIVAFLISLAPERVFEVVERSRENYPGIIWIPEEGPGGGGGGGGNESLEVPRMVELEGPDEAALSIPVEDPPELVEPDPEPEEEQTLETQELTISALTVASSVETRAGALEGLMAASILSQGSGAGGGAGTGEGTGIGPGQGDGLGPGQGGGTGGGVYRPGNGVNPPSVLREVKPQYTSEAMRARVQGTVWLDVVVLPDGSVGDITVRKSLDKVFGLDDQAITAAREWLFAPGTRFGEPVAVLVTLELFFNLR